MQGTALNGAIPSSVTAASPYEYLKKIDGQAVAATTVNSLADMVKRGGGFLATKTITCNGNGAQTDNLFAVTGAVEVLRIWAECTEATNATTFGVAFLDIYDSTAQVDITLDTGVDLAGIVVGGVISRPWSVASALAFLNNATGAFIDGDEQGGNESFPFQIVKKTAAATYLRFCFTGDANTDVDMKFYVQYMPLTSDGALVAA
jgi:hypothetical protein